MANETTWDSNTTTWDRDWDGPDTRTIWDLIPTDLKLDEVVIVQPARWLAVAMRE